jgi:hydrogenase maturation factor
LPEGTSSRDVERQFAELQRACGHEGISLIGGHTEITGGIDRPLLIGTLLGTVGPFGLLEPGKAQAGNDLWLTQAAGIEGTALLATERREELLSALGPDIVGVAKGLLIEPGITVSRDARALLATGKITALHDPTEGGVATAIHEIAAASRLGAEIDGAAIPVLPETAAICDHLGINPLGLLSSGALLVAAPPGVDLDQLAPMVPMTRIGTLTDTRHTLTISTERGIEPLPRFDSDEIARALL